MDKDKPFSIIKPGGLPEPSGPYSYCVKVKAGSTLLFLSGLAPRDKEGKGLVGYPNLRGKSKVLPAPPGEYTQTMRVMERLKEVLESGGATFDDVINAKVWVSDIKYLEKTLEAFGKHFKRYPTVTAVAVKALGLGQMVEIEVIAAI